MNLIPLVNLLRKANLNQSLLEQGFKRIAYRIRLEQVLQQKVNRILLGLDFRPKVKTLLGSPPNLKIILIFNSQLKLLHQIPSNQGLVNKFQRNPLTNLMQILGNSNNLPQNNRSKLDLIQWDSRTLCLKLNHKLNFSVRRSQQNKRKKKTSLIKLFLKNRDKNLLTNFSVNLKKVLIFLKPKDLDKILKDKSSTQLLCFGHHNRLILNLSRKDFLRCNKNFLQKSKASNLQLILRNLKIKLFQKIPRMKPMNHLKHKRLKFQIHSIWKKKKNHK